MRRRLLKGLGARLKELVKMVLSRDQLLPALGAAKSQFPAGLASWSRCELSRLGRKPKFIRPISPSNCCARTKLAPSAAAGKDAICCACSNLSGFIKNRRSCGGFTSSSRKWRRPSKISRTTLSLRFQFSIPWNGGWRRTYLFPFLAYCLHAQLAGPVCGPWLPRPDLPRFVAGKSLRPSRCSTCIFRPPTDGNWFFSSATVLQRGEEITKCCWRNWAAGNRRRNHPRASRRKANGCRE